MSHRLPTGSRHIVDRYVRPETQLLTPVPIQVRGCPFARGVAVCH